MAEWFLDMGYGVPVPMFPSAPPDPFIQKVVSARLDAQEIRAQAIVNLWRYAISTIRVRYPDPAVHVEVGVSRYADGLTIEFRLFGVRDTGDQSRRLYEPSGFLMPLYPALEWPGLSPAQEYLAAGWTLFLMHEAQELVTLRGFKGQSYRAHDAKGRVGTYRGERSVVDPHDRYSVNQKAIQATRYIGQTLDIVHGAGRGQYIVTLHKARANREIANEIDYLIGRVPRDA